MTEMDTTDNGDGTYTYDFEVCMGYEDTWGFYFTFTGPGNLVSWDGSVTSPSTGVTISASVPPISGNGDIEYGDYDNTAGSTFSGTCCDDCVTISLTFDDPITGAEVDGVQYIYGPCSGTPTNVTSCFESVAPNGVTATSDSICPGGSTQLSLNGGDLVAPSATWEWYSGSCGGTSEGSGSSITVTPSSTSTYYVRAESNCDSTKCASTKITVNSESTAPTAASASTNPICPGNSSDLSVSGGSLGTGASWEWYSGSCGGTSVGTGSPISVSPSSTTTYYVRAEGTCNTTSCESVTVNLNSESTAPTAASASTNPICTGNSTDLSVSGGSLGTGANREWYSGSCGGTAVGSGSPLTVSPTSTTTYYVRAEGTCNTTTCESVTVDVVPVPTVDAGPDQIICTGDTVQIGGSPTASGGTTPYSYSWNNTGSLDDGTVANPDAYPTSNTSYTVNVNDANGCSGTDQMTVTVNPLPTVSFSGLSASYCGNGSGDTLTGNQVPAGNFSGSGVTDLGSGEGYFDPTVVSAGTHDVYYSYTDANGCTNVDTQSVTIHAAPVLDSSNVMITMATCGNSDGAVQNLAVNAGTSPFTYEWRNASSTVVGNSLDLTGVPSGNYTISVSDANGCTDTLGPIGINDKSGPKVKAGSDTSMCEGDSLIIGGSPTATGGTTPYTYSWNNAGTLDDASVADPKAGPVSTTNYTVTVTDANGCNDSDNLTLTVDPQATVDAGPDSSVCANDTVILDGSYGGSASSVSWSSSGDGSFGTPGDTVSTYVPGSSDTSSGDATLTLTTDDPTGACPAAVDSLLASFLEVPKPDPKGSTLCQGDTVEIGVAAGASHLWSTGGTSDSIKVSPDSDSLYQVQVIAANTCSVFDSIRVKVDTPKSVLAVDDSLELQAGSSKDVNVTANDPAGPFAVSQGEAPDKGSLQGPISGVFTYNSTISEEAAKDSFTYRICDAACMSSCDTATVHVTITFEEEEELFIPNGVSANGDGFNDVFRISGLERYPNNRLNIFNRWGEEVYSAAPYENDWKGQGKSGKVLQGTYFYVLALGPEEGKKTGYIEFRR